MLTVPDEGFAAEPPRRRAVAIVVGIQDSLT